MPTYTPPVFNVPMDRWHAGHTPAANPPDITGQLFQIYVYSRAPNQVLFSGITQWLPVIIIREPVTASTHAAIGDILGAPAVGTTIPVEYYKVMFKQLIHFGFPNQYMMLWCAQCASNGTVPRHPQP